MGDLTILQLSSTAAVCGENDPRISDRARRAVTWTGGSPIQPPRFRPRCNPDRARATKRDCLCRCFLDTGKRVNTLSQPLQMYKVSFVTKVNPQGG